LTQLTTANWHIQQVKQKCKTIIYYIKEIFTLSESFEKCPRSANIASAPEIIEALEMPKYRVQL